jgi:hypothetical protein
MTEPGANMTEYREPLPPGLLERLREIVALSLLAGLTADETLSALNIEARKHGFEYGPPRTRPATSPTLGAGPSGIPLDPRCSADRV